MSRQVRGEAAEEAAGIGGHAAPPDIGLDVRGDAYLACTNGLVEALGDADLERILASSSNPHDASDRLVRAAREAGALDDITAVVVSVPSPRLWKNAGRKRAELLIVSLPD